jgi:hypothetical protein
MTSPSRRDLGGERLRSLSAHLGMLLQSHALWSSVKSQLGCCERCGGMLRPQGTRARRDFFTKTLLAPYGAPKGEANVWFLS